MNEVNESPRPVVVSLHAEGRDLNDNEVEVKYPRDIDTLLAIVDAELTAAEEHGYDPHTVLVTMPAPFFGGLVLAMANTMKAFKNRGGTVDELLS